MNKIVITEHKNTVYSCLLNEQNQLIEVLLEPKESISKVGNSYIGKVINIAKGIKAAFVDIGIDQHVFLPLEEGQKYLYTKGSDYDLSPKPGDELVVQIVKEGDHTKAPKVTSKINITGEHIVLTFSNTYVGISNKIEISKEKKRLKKLLLPYKNSEYGFVVRTNAEGVDAKILIEEVEDLVQQYNQLKEIIGFRPFKTCIAQPPSQYYNFIRDAYKQDLNAVVFDQKELYETYKRYKQCYEPVILDANKGFSLYLKYDLGKQIHRALEKRVWLKSGANITIEPTEALIAIDVNSGKIVVKKEREDFFLAINKEAALKIMDQIRLRNLSGIIIVDFIDMPHNSHKHELLDYLGELASRDRIKTEIIEMTKLGLVEIIRKKGYKSLEEQVRAL